MSVFAVVPNVDQNLETKNIYLKSGDTYQLRVYPATSWSDAFWNFSCPPPNDHTFISRRIMQHVRVRCTIVGTRAGANLLLDGNTALRAYPLAKVTNNLTVTLNGQPLSQTMNFQIPALERFNKHDEDHSDTPTMTDSYSHYDEDSRQSFNNPLASFRNAPTSSDNYNIPRGSFPFNVTANTPAGCVFEAEIFEPLLLSPLLFDDGNHSLGLNNVKTLDVSVQFNTPALTRIFSITEDITMTSCVVTFISQPELLFTYYTDHEWIPRPLSFRGNLNEFQQMQKPNLASGGVIAGYDMFSNIQLGTIPKSVIIWIDTLQMRIDPQQPDHALSIDGITMNFNNLDGQLTSLNPQQLYELSRDNCLTDTFQQFLGSTTVLGDAPALLSGSFLKLAFGKDIMLNGGYVGQIGAFNFNFGIKYSNKTGRNVSPVINALFQYHQEILVPPAGGIQVIRGLPPIGDASYVAYDAVREMYQGAGIKEWWDQKALPWLKKAHQWVKDHKIISGVANALGSAGVPFASTIGSTAAKMGYGEGEGGMTVGGRALTKKQLLQALKKY